MAVNVWEGGQKTEEGEEGDEYPSDWGYKYVQWGLCVVKISEENGGMSARVCFSVSSAVCKSREKGRKKHAIWSVFSFHGWSLDV